MSDSTLRRHQDLLILNKIAQALNSSVDLGEAIRVTLAQVAELLQLQTGWVWLLQEETGQPYVAAAQNLPAALAHDPRQMEGYCYCLNSFRDGDLAGAANVNVVECSRLRGLVDGTDDLRYHASIPLYAHGKKLGVLNVASQDWRELEDDDLRLLYTVGDLLGIAIERGRLYEQSIHLGAVEERNRLAREIHDTLAQSMSAVALHLESADALLDAGRADKGHRAVQKALDLTRANIENLRRSVLDLRAAPLECKQLAEAIEELAGKCQKEWQLPITVHTVGAHMPLPVRVEVALYRIVQEALNNIHQHAQANQVQIDLIMTPQQVTLTIKDNGKGFNPGQTFPNHFGLVGLNERTKLLGGELQLHSDIDKGTQIHILIPLVKESSQ